MDRFERELRIDSTKRVIHRRHVLVMFICHHDSPPFKVLIQPGSQGPWCNDDIRLPISDPSPFPPDVITASPIKMTPFQRQRLQYPTFEKTQNPGRHIYFGCTHMHTHSL